MRGVGRAKGVNYVYDGFWVGVRKAAKVMCRA